MPSSLLHKMKVLFPVAFLAVGAGHRWELPVGRSQGNHDNSLRPVHTSTLHHTCTHSWTKRL